MHPSISNIMKNTHVYKSSPVHNIKLESIPKQGIKGTSGHIKFDSSEFDF
jgi:hypothetical protein